MEDANIKGTSHPSVAPAASLDLAGNPVDQAPLLVSSNSHEGDQPQQRIDQDHTVVSLTSNDSNRVGKLQGEGNDPDSNSAGEMRAGNSSYKASEIADRFIQVIDGKARIDTAAPIDSVKGAVSKFGGILDWKERRKQIQDGLDKVQEEVTEYQKRSQEAEVGKAQVLQELGSTTSAIDELGLSLQKAQAEEAHARQDSELAELRLRETQQGVSESTAAKAELDVVRDRHAAALADLQSAKAELGSLQKEHAAAAAEADAVTERARETDASSQEADKAVQELTAELIALKEELHSSHAAHDEAEEKQMKLALALEQDKVQRQTELEQAEQDVKKLGDELMAAKNLESKVSAASELLVSLRAELFARAVEGTLGEEEKPTVSTQAMLDKTKKELEDVIASVQKAKDEAKCLRVAAASLRADLEKEKAELAALRRKEGVSSASIPSLEEELSRVTSELAEAEARAKEGGEESKMPAQLSEARREAEQAKANARSAHEEVAKAREEAGVAKAAVHAMEARLEAVMREILAANASEEIATASADALLQESKPARNAQSQGIEGGVTLTAEEYDELSRRARETEEVAGKRVTEAAKLIKEAKDAEVRSLENLAQLAKQTEQRRQALRAANEEIEEAEFGKLAAERELRQWRAEHEHQRRVAGETASPRTGLAEISVFDDPSGAGDGRGNPHILSPRGYMPRGDMVGSAAAEEAEAEAKQRKTFFPRMVMFLARKRAQSWK